MKKLAFGSPHPCPSRKSGRGCLAPPAGAEPPPMHEQPRPTADRIEALDFLRGVALFGILLMNINGAGLTDAYYDPTNWGGATGVDLWAWIIAQVGFEGTQRGLFSILFGAGILLFTDRLEAKGRDDAGPLWIRRMLILAVFGMINAFLLLWPGDILFRYAVSGLFLIFFTGLPGRTLLAIGGGLLLFGVALDLAESRETLALHDRYQAALTARAAGAELTPVQDQAIDQWEAHERRFKPPREAMERTVAGTRAGYTSAYREIAPDSVELLTAGFLRYPHDAIGMMLIGMGLFRIGLLTGERSRRLYALMALGGYAVGLATNIAEASWLIRNGFSVVAFAQTDISYEVGRLAMTVGHLGAMLWIVKNGLLPRTRRAMAAVGQMALTNYLAQSVAYLVLFILLGFYGQFSRAELLLVVLAIWAVQLAFSTWWLSRYRFGPLEWLWRALTYGTRPPLRRAAPAPAA
jgi:uncharacterized protein